MDGTRRIQIGHMAWALVMRKEWPSGLRNGLRDPCLGSPHDCDLGDVAQAPQRLLQPPGLRC